MSKHTPGPWFRVGGNIYGGASERKKNVAMMLAPGYPESTYPYERYNSALICAAPEMLEALKEARAIITSQADIESNANAQKALLLIDAAIEKAEKPLKD